MHFIRKSYFHRNQFTRMVLCYKYSFVETQLSNRIFNFQLKWLYFILFFSHLCRAINVRKSNLEIEMRLNVFGHATLSFHIEFNWQAIYQSKQRHWSYNGESIQMKMMNAREFLRVRKQLSEHRTVAAASVKWNLFIMNRFLVHFSSSFTQKVSTAQHSTLVLNMQFEFCSLFRWIMFSPPAVF